MKENKITFKYTYDIDKDEAEIEIEGYSNAGDLIFAAGNCLAEVLFEVTTNTEEATGFDRSEIKEDIKRVAQKRYLNLLLFGREDE